MKKIPLLISKAEGKISDSDVSGSTRRLVSDAKNKFKKTASDINNSLLAWVTAYGILLAIQSQLNDAMRKAANDIEEEEAMCRRRRSESCNSYSSSSYGGSSGGGSGFGGFGGGGFGGGGASGSW